MRRPFGMYTDRSTKPGRTLLRAGNAIDSIGKGPAELLGTRIGPRFMRARQRIYKRDGGRIGIATDGRLQFKFAHLSRLLPPRPCAHAARAAALAARGALPRVQQQLPCRARDARHLGRLG